MVFGSRSTAWCFRLRVALCRWGIDSVAIRGGSRSLTAGVAVDAQTGVPRYLPPAEPAEWARAIFSTVDSAHGYFLGAVDPGTGVHRRGQLVYRLYVDTDRRAIPVPRQVVTCPHYLLLAIDGRAEITIPTTA